MLGRWVVYQGSWDARWLGELSDSLSKWSWTLFSFGLNWIIVSLSLLRWEKHLACRLVCTITYQKCRTAVNVQFLYWEAISTQTQKNSFKCNHKMMLPATFCNWNSKETGAFPPFSLCKIMGYVIPCLW